MAWVARKPSRRSAASSSSCVPMRRPVSTRATAMRRASLVGPVIVAGDQRADAAVGEELGDDGVRLPPVEDVDPLHPAGQRRLDRLHLPLHAAGDGAGLDPAPVSSAAGDLPHQRPVGRRLEDARPRRSGR